jgi:hypothetical protein
VTKMSENLMIVQKRNHELTISLGFLGIILRVLRLEVFVYNVYIKHHAVSTPFLLGRGGGILNLLVEVTVNSKEENS